MDPQWNGKLPCANRNAWMELFLSARYRVTCASGSNPVETKKYLHHNIIITS